MNIKIRKPLGYSHIGRKDQQEDAVWPPFDTVTADDRCIILCDGVGGSEHGEVASQTSAKVIGEYLTEVLAQNDFVSKEDMQQAVTLAHDELDRIDTEPNESGRVSMATTLTCVCFHKDGILAAHMGDSRIYHIRPGQGLLYQTDDHSLVNALLKAGELTPEEAKTFPRKNVIIRALQPHGERRFKAECHQLTDVQSGDYIFLCSDGVLEQVNDERLVEVLSMDCSDEEKLELLQAESLDKTRDNYTAYLIPITEATGVSTIQHEEIATVVLDSSGSLGQSESGMSLRDTSRSAQEKSVDLGAEDAVQETSQSGIGTKVPQYVDNLPVKSPRRYLSLLGLLAVVVLILTFFHSRCSTKDSDSKTQKVERILNAGNLKDSQEIVTPPPTKVEEANPDTPATVAIDAPPTPTAEEE